MGHTDPQTDIATTKLWKYYMSVLKATTLKTGCEAFKENLPIVKKKKEEKKKEEILCVFCNTLIESPF